MPGDNDGTKPKYCKISRSDKSLRWLTYGTVWELHVPYISRSSMYGSYTFHMLGMIVLVELK